MLLFLFHILFIRAAQTYSGQNVSLLETGHSFDVVPGQEISALLSVDIHLILHLENVRLLDLAHAFDNASGQNVRLLDTTHLFDVIPEQEISSLLTFDVNLILHLDRMSDFWTCSHLADALIQSDLQ